MNSRDKVASDLEKLVSDGERALAIVFQRSAPRLQRMIESRLDDRLRTRVDADDVLQDAYVEAASRLDDYLANPDAPPSVWIRFLVNQQIAQAYRWYSRRKRDASRELNEQIGPSDFSILDQLIDSDTSPSLVVARIELQSMLRSIVVELDGIDREIVCLRHFEELSNTEAAAELSITPAAASKRYLRALTRLREIMGGTDRL